MSALEPISPFPPRPVPRPVMFQSWRFLTFFHWRYDPDQIRRLLPPQLTLDTFDGAAWIGLTPFLLTDLRPPVMPSLPWISRFPETNVRTYVRGPDGERGIWFFTLEADRLAAVIGARSLYRLPYRWSAMSVTPKANVVEYRSRRNRPFGSARTDIATEIGTPVTPSERDNFLTARFRLYTITANRLAFAQIEHPPWPLHSGWVQRLEQDLIERSGVPRPTGEPSILYSPGVDVRIGRLRLFKQ